MKKFPFSVRLEDDLIDDLNSDDVLDYYRAENVSQLARRLFREGVDRAKNKQIREEKKAEFRV
jgi:metal-responsive CopG/Arc/MetJ family transcriptional regulator